MRAGASGGFATRSLPVLIFIPMRMRMRVLVTGSRYWDDYSYMYAVLSEHIEAGDTLISGTARGADQMAESMWEHYRLPIERYPANWSLGRGAGLLRNEQMVDTDPDICIAFFKVGARNTGTTHCANYAQKKGVSVVTVWG